MGTSDTTVETVSEKTNPMSNNDAKEDLTEKSEYLAAIPIIEIKERPTLKTKSLEVVKASNVNGKTVTVDKVTTYRRMGNRGLSTIFCRPPGGFCRS